MFGFSVFMNQDLSEADLAQMEELALSFEGMFTSMHIPEDDRGRYRERLGVIGTFAKTHQLSLMVDISGNALSEAGFSTDRLEDLIALGVTGLRMDYAIDNQQIAQFSQHIRIALNASTLTEKDVQELQTFGADFSKLEAWHNYYPRPETGLDEEWVHAKNRWLKEQGFYVQAFVPGDDRLRGPLYAGLPTLEDHRGMAPFAAALALQQSGTVDAIYIGDGGLTRQSVKQFNDYLQQGIVTLRVSVCGSDDVDAVLGLHQNRQDEARDVLRSASARFGKVPFVKADIPKPRPIGAVTIDNQNYLRYMGEIQVCKMPLPADPRVNVAAQVIMADLPLIQHIHAGMRFKIERDDSNE